jgi:hypothetical protein
MGNDGEGVASDTEAAVMAAQGWAGERGPTLPAWVRETFEEPPQLVNPDKCPFLLLFKERRFSGFLP